MSAADRNLHVARAQRFLIEHRSARASDLAKAALRDAAKNMPVLAIEDVGRKLGLKLCAMGRAVSSKGRFELR
jgi:hypothetical protein